MVRGIHPDDPVDFGPDALPRLLRAAADLTWLLGRGYADDASTTLVGDRFQLTRRQRSAIQRATCAPEAAVRRRAARVADLRGEDVHIDGFNVLLPVERALQGGPVFRGAEGAWRDLGGLNGTWRSGGSTREAAVRVAPALLGARSVTWWLDRPVSNSGRLAVLLRETAAAEGHPWEVVLEDHVDPALAACGGVVATSDAWILERGVRWVDLVGPVLAGMTSPWTVLLDAIDPSPLPPGAAG
ncbi:MAG: DUF434 domain-containing protein [Alphaproteobacteria bacterium]|nr:DUF434 domain-containing protein [Alphaproteobacteria bacterium]